MAKSQPLLLLVAPAAARLSLPSKSELFQVGGEEVQSSLRLRIGHLHGVAMQRSRECSCWAPSARLEQGGGDRDCEAAAW